jgi:hypothetical protein
MAKINGPLHSDSATGQWGKVMVFSYWKGQSVSKKYVANPSNPNTAAQLVVRGYFSTAVNAWQAENSTIKSAWNTYASNTGYFGSGFNLYVGQYCLFLKGNAGTPPTVTNTPPTMT